MDREGLSVGKGEGDTMRQVIVVEAGDFPEAIEEYGGCLEHELVFVLSPVEKIELWQPPMIRKSKPYYRRGRW